MTMVIEEMQPSERVSAFYTRTYRQSFSPDGDWLISTDSRSRLCLFNVPSALSPKASTSMTRPLFAQIRLERPVFALHTFDSLLICGDCSGQLFAYDWSVLGKTSSDLETPKRIFQVNAFTTGLGAPAPDEVNAITSMDGRILYAGAGNCAVNILDIQRPDKVISSFAGHEDYVNEIAVRSPYEFISASEDGTVRLWDTRVGIAHVIRVYDEPAVRTNNGKGVCALAVHGAFMVCGGDVELGIWHLDSRSLASRMGCAESYGSRYLVAKMDSDKILVGAACPYLIQYTHAGEYRSSVKTAQKAIYSIEKNEADGKRITTVAGDSQYIDAFIDIGYVSFHFNSSLQDDGCSGDQ